MDGSLHSTSNYKESYRTVEMPYQEYRTTYSSGTASQGNGAFDLERQVQHMLPASNGLRPRLGNFEDGNVQASSVVQQSYSSYKVQTNQYMSNGEKISPMLESSSFKERSGSGSKLKQNIDDLDSLLNDLDHVRKEADDHLAVNGSAKKSLHAYNEYSVHQYGKPPSPLPRRRAGPGSSPLSSPGTVRRSSPGPTPKHVHTVSAVPVGPTGPTGPAGGYSSSYSYSASYNQSSSSKDYPSGPKDYPSGPKDYPSGPKDYPPYSTTPLTSRRTPPPATDPAPPPGGMSYYSKYHSSSSSHQSLGTPAPVTFPSRPQTPLSTQSPPKRVTQLLSEFDIHDTGFVEPERPKPRTEYRPLELEPYQPATTTSIKTTYYPEKERPVAAVSSSSSSAWAGARGKASYEAERSYKAKEMSKQTESETTKTAVVPICLPLCCAAPCVIL